MCFCAMIFLYHYTNNAHKYVCACFNYVITALKMVQKWTKTRIHVFILMMNIFFKFTIKYMRPNTYCTWLLLSFFTSYTHTHTYYICREIYE